MEDDVFDESKFKELTTKPVEKLICKLAVPTIISMLITSFYNMADTFFMGKINTSATAAVGIIFSLMAIIQAIGFFFGHGSGNYISRELGKQNFEDSSVMAAVGFFSSFLMGIVLMILGYIFLTPFAVLLGSTSTILPYAKTYMGVILLGAPFMMSSLTLNNQLRFQGYAVYAMLGIGGGALLNVILDPIFIFVFNLGIFGAGLATALSQVFSFIVLLVCSIKTSCITIKLKNFKPCVNKYLNIATGGMPSLFRQALASIATILLNRAVGGYGDSAVAAMSIVLRVTNFAASALIGFGQGFQPVCGFNYGAKLYDRVIKAFWFCIKVSSIFLIIVGISGFAFAPSIVRVFCKGQSDVISIGALSLRLQCITFPLLGFITLSNMMLQNINKYKEASFIAAARQGIFFIPLILILPSLFGLLGAQVCQASSDVLTFLVALPIQLKLLKNMKEEIIKAKSEEDKSKDIIINS